MKGFNEESEEIKSKELKDTRESEENIALNILKTKLKLDLKTPARFSDLFAAFSNEPPIIQIIIFDKIYAIRKRTGTFHASIISQVDLEEKKITVIDPQNYDDNDIIVPYHFDLNAMARGWERAQNAVVWVYPIEAKKDFEIKSGKLKVVKYKKIKMDNYFNN